MGNKKDSQPAYRRQAGSQDGWRFPLNEQKKASSLFLIRQEIQQKRIQRRPTFAENVWNQLRFHSWKHWAMQGALLLAAMLLAFWFYKSGDNGADSIAACSVFLVFAGNICLSSVAQLFSYHMAELEKTLYLDLKQMVCIRMLEAGILDLAILALLTGFLAGAHRTFAYFLYLLVPFLWSDVLYLHMLARFRSIFSGFWQLSAGLLCAVLAVFPAFWEDAYSVGHLPAWGLLCAAGCLMLAAEIHAIFTNIEGGDNICLN